MWHSRLVEEILSCRFWSDVCAVMSARLSVFLFLIASGCVSVDHERANTAGVGSGSADMAKLIRTLQDTSFGWSNASTRVTVDEFVAHVDSIIWQLTGRELGILVGVENSSDVAVRCAGQLFDNTDCWGVYLSETNLATWSVWDALWWAERVTGLACVVDDDNVVLVDKSLFGSLEGLYSLFGRLPVGKVKNAVYVPDGQVLKMRKAATREPGADIVGESARADVFCDPVMQARAERLLKRLQGPRLRDVDGVRELVGEKWLASETRVVHSGDVARLMADVLPRIAGVKVAYYCSGSVCLSSFVKRSFAPWTRAFNDDHIADKVFGRRKIGELTVLEVLWLLHELYGQWNTRDHVLLLRGQSDNGSPRYMRIESFPIPVPKEIPVN